MPFDIRPLLDLPGFPFRSFRGAGSLPWGAETVKAFFSTPLPGLGRRVLTGW
jgi:hypothetical protein